jgi:hypothetical protein
MSSFLGDAGWEHQRRADHEWPIGFNRTRSPRLTTTKDRAHLTWLYFRKYFIPRHTAHKVTYAIRKMSDLDRPEEERTL